MPYTADKIYSWNPWHGCHKISAGCKNCYVYRIDSRYDRDSSIVTKNKDFSLPLKKNKKGEYKFAPKSLVNTCFTSDFFVEDADDYRNQAWDIISKRKDLNFFFITKRIDRFYDCIPKDWGSGYKNVHICCTVENQEMADYRLPIFNKVPIFKKSITCSPLLEKIDISSYLNENIEIVVAGGESGTNARFCDYSWITHIKNQCVDKKVKFKFYQTGAKLVKNGKLYYIKRKYQHAQASKADIDVLKFT